MDTQHRLAGRAQLVDGGAAVETSARVCVERLQRDIAEPVCVCPFTPPDRSERAGGGRITDPQVFVRLQILNEKADFFA